MGTTNFDNVVCDSITATTSVIETQTIQDLTATGTTVIGNAVTDTTAITGATTITSTSANALTVGRLGATTPVLKVNAATATVVT